MEGMFLPFSIGGLYRDPRVDAVEQLLYSTLPWKVSRGQTRRKQSPWARHGWGFCLPRRCWPLPYPCTLTISVSHSHAVVGTLVREEQTFPVHHQQQMTGMGREAAFPFGVLAWLSGIGSGL